MKQKIVLSLSLILLLIAQSTIAADGKKINISALQLLLLENDDKPSSSRELPDGYIHLAGKGNNNVSGSGNGNEYWVDQNHPNASDSGAGSKTMPWRTFKHAVETAMAGDTVNVMPGVYIDSTPQGSGAWTAFFPTNSGEIGNPITFRSVVPKAAVLKSSSTSPNKATRGKALAFYGRHDIIFDGFKAIGLVHFLGTERINFINGEVTVGSIAWNDPSLLWGISVERSDNCVIRNNLIHSMMHAEKNGVKYLSHNQAGIMLFGGANGGSKNNLIEYNQLDMNNNVYAGLGNKGGNLVGNVWRNNFVKNANSGIFSIGSTDGEYSVDSSVYSFNIVLNNKFGVEFDNKTNDSIVNNNTIVNSSNSAFKLVALNSTNITFVNNIVSKSRFAIYADAYSGTVVSHFLDVFGVSNFNLFNQITDDFAVKEKSPRLGLSFQEYQARGHGADDAIASPGFINGTGLNPQDYKRSSYPSNGEGLNFPSVKGAYTSNSDIVGNY